MKGNACHIYVAYNLIQREKWYMCTIHHATQSNNSMTLNYIAEATLVVVVILSKPSNTFYVSLKYFSHDNRYIIVV